MNLEWQEDTPIAAGGRERVPCRTLFPCFLNIRKVDYCYIYSKYYI